MFAPLRKTLRDGTRAAHDRVDAVFDRFALTEREGYGAFLSAHHAALTALPLEPAPYGLPPIALAPLLAADLRALGAVPVSGEPLALRGEDERLGAYYVVAGSRLGARVLEARWAEATDPVVRRAGRYLSDRTMAAGWTALGTVLSDEAALDGDRVLAGALAAFGVFERAGRDRLAQRLAGAA